MGDYKKLLVWQRARDLADELPHLIARLPPDQRKRIADQLIRATDSIRFNLAEGCGLNSDRQLARHVLISLGSACEVQDQLESLEAVGALSEQDRRWIEEIARLRSMLISFHRRLLEPKRDSSSRNVVREVSSGSDAAALERNEAACETD